MSCNARVSEQVRKMSEAYGKDKALYKIEREKYWQVLEEELLKAPRNGWVDLEDPGEYLGENLYGEHGSAWTEYRYKEMVAEVLPDYIRFHQIVEKTGAHVACKFNPKMVEDARKYIAG